MREYSSETCLQFETSDTERSHQGNQINNGVERNVGTASLASGYLSLLSASNSSENGKLLLLEVDLAFRPEADWLAVPSFFLFTAASAESLLLLDSS